MLYAKKGFYIHEKRGAVLKVGARGFNPTYMPFEQTLCPYGWRYTTISKAFLDSPSSGRFDYGSGRQSSERVMARIASRMPKATKITLISLMSCFMIR